jgi:hypothetical protein
MEVTLLDNSGTLESERDKKAMFHDVIVTSSQKQECIVEGQGMCRGLPIAFLHALQLR